MSAVLMVLLACKARHVEGSVKTDRDVVEPSGLVRSGERLWTHPDSQNPPVIWAINRKGELLQEVQVSGAENTDWEDITRDDAGQLWLADIGNNLNARKDLALHRLSEPGADDTEASVDLSVPVSYPDQDEYPDKDKMNFDAESLFFAGGDLFILTKHRSDSETTLYRVPALSEEEQVLERISSFELGGDPDNYGGQATSADLSPDGGTLAVLSYHAVFLFSRPESGVDWLSRPLRTIPLDQEVLQQCEGIAWYGDDLLIVNEDGWVFTLADAEDTKCTRYPTEGC